MGGGGYVFFFFVFFFSFSVTLNFYFLKLTPKVPFSKMAKQPDIELQCLLPYFFGYKTNRIWSPMQTENSQPEGKGIMPETRFTEFLALSIDTRVGISRSASKIDD